MTATRSLTCPACGGGIEVKAAGYSVTVACQYCGSVLDVAHPDVKVIEEFHLAAMQLLIPLGARGVLEGIEWEAIGYLGRTDGDESWDEFLLFNPYAGYRWLTHAHGEWQFGTMLTDQPDGTGEWVSWRGGSYEADYEPAVTTTERVVGEFYWRVRADDRVQAMTYSGAGQQLSVEWSADETNWTVLVDKPASVIEAAFGIRPDAALAASGSGSGIDDVLARFRERAEAGTGGAGRPRGLADLVTMAKIGGAALVVILVIMIGFGWGSGSASKSFDVVVGGSGQNQTVGTLTLTRPYQFVTVSARTSDFTNRWVELDYSLVDRATQQAIEASGTVEYYRGRDSDGEWSEGSHSATTKFAGVPRGTYDIVVDASAHAWGGGSSSYSSASSAGPWGSAEKIGVRIDARAGGIPWSNFFATIFLMLGLPGLAAWLRSRA